MKKGFRRTVEYCVFEKQDRMATFLAHMVLNEREIAEKVEEYATAWAVPNSHVTICLMNVAKAVGNGLRAKWYQPPEPQSFGFAYAVRYKGRHVEKFLSDCKLTESQINARKRAYLESHDLNPSFVMIVLLEDCE